MEPASQQPVPHQSIRPASITVISWILIVLGILSLISTLRTLGNENLRHAMEQAAAASGLSFPVSTALSLAGIAIGPITGIGMLLRRGWVRFLYVIWHVVMFAFSFAINPRNIGLMIPSTLILVVFSIIVFRPAAKKYFLNIPTNPATTSVGPAKIILYMISCFFIFMVSLLAFFAPDKGLPLAGKITIMAIFAAPALIALCFGFLAGRNKRKLHETGVVLLSSAAFDAFCVLSALCMWTSPDIKKQLANSEIDVVALLSDYTMGFGFMAALALLGFLFWRLGLGSKNPSPTPVILRD